LAPTELPNAFPTSLAPVKFRTKVESVRYYYGEVGRGDNGDVAATVSENRF
jgi:hypothetical protein